MHIKTSEQPALELGFGGYTCNWGTHICGLYESDEERDEIILGFLGKGLEAGDMQLYCPAERTFEEFIRAFTAKCPHCANKLHDPSLLQLLPPKDLYYPDGEFSPWKMDDGLNSFFHESQKKGPRNIRGTAEMAWALEAIPGVEHLMAYESRLNYFIPGKPWISVCLYNLKKFDGKTIMDVLRTHPFTISRGVITQNPYYMNPDDWLSANAPQYLPGRRERA